MRCEIKIKDNHITMPLDELFWLLHESYEDEFDAKQLIERLGWIEPIREEFLRSLMEEFSRPNYNEGIHDEREQLLVSVKQEEIKYYASKLAGIIEDKRRWQKNYWKLYHFYRDRLHQISTDFPPPTEDIDFDFKKELQVILEKDMTEKLMRRA